MDATPTTKAPALAPPDPSIPQLVVRIVVGLILLVAAGLKAYGLATTPTLGKTFFESRPFLGAVINVEIWLGAFLLAGVFLRFVWPAAAAAFAVFLMVAVYRGASGEASCGCFGPVEINPWWTAGLDAAVFLALAVFWPRANGAAPRSGVRPSSPWPRALSAAAVAMVACVVADVAAARYKPTVITRTGKIEGRDDKVVLEPATWVGHPWPMLEHADVAGELRRGAWVVVLYRYGCSHCDAALPRYLDWARAEQSSGGKRRLAVLQIAPYPPPDPPLVPAGTPCLVGKLSDEKKWIIRTPCEIHLENGAVTAVAERETDSRVLSTSRPAASLDDQAYHARRAS